MNELLHTYSTPDIVPAILVGVIFLMMLFWPEHQQSKPDPRADQMRARRQMNAATRETLRRMREAANDLDDDDRCACERARCEMYNTG